jgi:hypothetical protein
MTATPQRRDQIIGKSKPAGGEQPCRSPPQAKVAAQRVTTGRCSKRDGGHRIAKVRLETRLR